MADKSLNKTELVAKVAADSGQSQAAVDGVL
ncbi:MAG TPA: integration host factor, partial [Glaciibacter sp.]|nr:integration host factor [Glaciibacter sp.]